MIEFELHPRLAADTVYVTDWILCRVLLMNDARFPWIILVPRVSGAVELFDLSFDQQTRATREASRGAAALKVWAGADKMNIAALGNVVPQLHIHIIARKVGDAAWPSPVWNAAGSAVRYENPNALATQLLKAL